MQKKTAALAALITLLGSAVGGKLFLQKNPNPTLKEVYASCEAGDLSGAVCCENMSQVTDILKPVETQCGMITPTDHDPLGLRASLEAQWDENQKESP